MTSSQKISIVFNVSFASVQTGILIIEIDDRDEGYNKGKTSGFYPSEPVGLLLYVGPKVKHTATNVSLGSVSFEGTTSVEKEETLVFSAPDKLSNSLKYPKSEIISTSWIGNALGDYEISDDNVVTVKCDKPYGVGVFSISYTAAAKTGKLNTPALALKNYEIAVQVVGNFEG